MIKKIIKFLPVFMLLISSKLALAESTCMLNGEEIPCDEMGEAVGGLMSGVMGVGLLFMIIFFVFWVWATIFWIMMIVHAVKHDIEHKPVWILVVVLTGIVGAIIYYFSVKRKFNKVVINKEPAVQTNTVPPQEPITPENTPVNQ